MVNKILKKLTLIILTVLVINVAFAQQDSLDNDLTISLVTGSAGSDLYAVFGHSAIRVQDKVRGTDILYNYGTFDFNTPNFYWKFIRGKLPYALSLDRTSDLARLYDYENRSLSEQVLNLNNEQERSLVDFLNWNAQPENRFYLYDFFYDNCATVIRDIFEKEYNIRYKIEEKRTVTFRNLLDEKLINSPWSDFGIDLILGAPADEQADFRDQMFLPSYLADNLAQAYMGDTPLMQPVQMIQAKSRPEESSRIFFTPMLLFVIVAVVGIIITLGRSQRAKNILDIILFTSCGLAGVFFTFMWFGTDHIATKENWNLLWLNPLYLVLVIGITRKSGTWLTYAFAANATILWLTLLGWNWLPQQFHVAVIPIIILLIARSMDREGVMLDLVKKATRSKLKAIK